MASEENFDYASLSQLGEFARLNEESFTDNAIMEEILQAYTNEDVEENFRNENHSYELPASMPLDTYNISNSLEDSNIQSQELELICETLMPREPLFNGLESHMPAIISEIVPQSVPLTTTEKNNEASSSLYSNGICHKSLLPFGSNEEVMNLIHFLEQTNQPSPGVKPFECNEPDCARKFTTRSDLRDHICKCHTGERPYKCLICDKSFMTGSVFYQHRLIHRGDRRHKCLVCDKSFFRADALKNHQRIHTGEKPFECDFCTKSFRQRGDRDKHMKARHSNLDENTKILMKLQKLELVKATAAKKVAHNISGEENQEPNDQVLDTY
uniref:C2H2-type domain-containing protein n=1 Tax=Stomoxys calcitrans TaxID=35570 RepID=A0A1I8PQE6_STOCA